MRKVTLSLIPLFALAFSLSAFAQAERDVKTGGEGHEETLKLSINGGWSVGWAVYDRDVMGVAMGAPDIPEQNVIVGSFHLDFNASLQDNVDILLRVERPHSDGGIDDSADPANFESQWNILAAGGSSRGQDSEDVSDYLQLNQAVIIFREVFDPAITVKFGVQEHTFDVRGRGNPFFFALGQANDPWDDLSTSGIYGGVSRPEQRWAGLIVSYGREGMGLNFGYLQTSLDDEGSDADPIDEDGSQLFFAEGIFDITDDGGKLGVIIVQASGHDSGPGSGHDEDVLTVGVSASVPVAQDIEVFGEVYSQDGTVVDGTPDLDHDAMAWQVGVRFDFPGSTPAWLEVSLSSRSGGDGLTDPTADSENFMSYENNDDMLFLDSNEWGMDHEYNIEQIKVKGGVELSPGLNFIAKLAVATAAQDDDYETAVAGAGEDLGTELDLTLEYNINKNARVYVTIAHISGADIAEAFVEAGFGPGTGEDGGMIIMIGSDAGF